MEHTPRTLLMQFSQLCQLDLFPVLETETGELSPQDKLLAENLGLAQLHRFVHKQCRGRHCDDRRALIAAFLAKSIHNLPTARQLIDRLKADSQLRSICGRTTAAAVPSESTFSRAFAEFSRRKLPKQIHEALVRHTQQDRIVGHIARDSTAIEAREKFPETPSQKRAKKRSKAKKKPLPKPRSKHEGVTAKQRKMTLPQMLNGISRDCSIGVKANSKGHTNYWRGYKLHLDVADGQIPVTAILSGANVHDAKVAIPLMTLTSAQLTYLYDVMDSAYDATAILAHSRQLGHEPIVDPNGRRATRKPSQLPKIFPAKQKPQLCPAKAERYKERTMVERVNARLKDEFGGRTLRVRGAAKVMAHLMFGVIALTVDQLLQLTT
jgi:hypothetical protein